MLWTNTQNVKHDHIKNLKGYSNKFWLTMSNSSYKRKSKSNISTDRKKKGGSEEDIHIYRLKVFSEIETA